MENQGDWLQSSDGPMSFPTREDAVGVLLYEIEDFPGSTVEILCGKE